MNEKFNSNLAGILECTEDAIISVYLDGTIKSWTKSSEKMFGYKSKEMIGKNISLIIPSELLNDDKSILSKISNYKNVVCYETTRIKKNGEQLYVSMIVTSIKDSAGSITGFYQVARDITCQKKKEAELIEAYKELAFQNQETEKRAAELLVANEELAFQNEEKDKRAAKLIIANEELAFQNKEKENRAAEMLMANKELDSLNKTQKALFAAIVNSSDDAMMSKSLDLIITSWNHGAEKIFGYSANEIIGKSVLMLIPPQLQQEEIDLTKKILAGETVDNYKTLRTRKNGAVFNALLTLSPIKNFDGIIIGASKILRDITEQELVEIKLSVTRKEIADYKFALDQSSIVAITDQKGIITYVNDKFLYISKYSREELIGQDHRIISSGYHSSNFIKKLWVTIANGKIWKGELKNKAKDGTIYWVDTTIVPFLDNKGKPYQYMAIRADITERKNADEDKKQLTKRLLLATQSAQMGIWDWDIKNNVLTWDEGMYKLYNIAENEFNSVYEGWFSRLHPEDRQLVQNEFELAVANKKDYKPEFRIVWNDSTVHYLKASGIIEKDNDGNAIRIIGANWDVTAEKEKEQQKNNLLTTLEKSLNEIYVFDAETLKFSYVNQGALLNNGYSEQEIKELTPLDIKPEFTATTFNQLINPLVTNEKEKIIFFTNHKRKNGSLYPVEIHLQFVTEGNNKRFLAVILDITERKKAEGKLIESENYLQTILDNEPECVKVLNKKGELVSMNPAGLAMIEADNEEQVLGCRMTDLVNKKYHSGFNQLSKEIFKGNRGIFEFEITGLKGGCRWLETHAVPLKDTTGKIVNLLGVTRDITERKKAVEKIIESENRMRLATSSAGMGIWYWDNKNDNMVWDKKLYQIYDINESQLGSVYEGWLSRLHPEDKVRVNEVMQTAIADKKREYSSEFRIILSDLSVRYIKGTGITEYDDKGNVIGMMGVNWDVTAEKEKEQHLKLLESVIINTTDSVMITEAEPFDEPGPKILYVNDAFTKMTGYSSEEVIGKTPRILQGPKSDMIELKRLGKAIRRWETCEITSINYKKSGEEFWINFSLTPVANEKGWYTHWIAIERDVTDLKKYISAIENQNIMLRKIAWTQSHIVRAPLARMLGLVHLIKDTKLDSTEYYEWLNHFTDSANELDNIIKDIVSNAQNILVKTD